MTIVGVMGCAALLVSAFGMYDGMHDLKEWEYSQINHYDSKLIVNDNASISSINNIADEVNGDKLMESAIEIESGNAKKSGSLLVLQYLKKWLICWVLVLVILSNGILWVQINGYQQKLIKYMQILFHKGL